ncbi:MAG: hypothetical protein AAGM27_00615 [Cyanobacteria bacterium J06554_3]
MKQRWPVRFFSLITGVKIVKSTYQELCTHYEGTRRTALVTQLETRYGWQPDKADRVLTQYLMFLYIASRHQENPLVPTSDIDCVWETDILQNTAQYMETCQQLCGGVIHHAGATGLPLTPDKDNVQQAFKETQQLFQLYFGQEVFTGQTLKIAACGVL